MSEPLKIVVARYRCPHCPKTYAHKATTANHIGKCWYNPAARGCKTCEHFSPFGPAANDECAVGVSLAGSDPFTEPEVKPGPITGCAKWQAKTDLYEE